MSKYRDSLRRIYDRKEYAAFNGQLVTGRDIREGRYRWIKNDYGERELREWKPATKPKSERPVCGAKTRAGGQCKAKGCLRPDGAISRRCRMHGGLSTGPKGPKHCPTHTPEARALILDGIAKGGTVVKVCRRAKVSPGSFYLWREREPAFEADVRRAYQKSQGYI